MVTVFNQNTTRIKKKLKKNRNTKRIKYIFETTKFVLKNFKYLIVVEVVDYILPR